MNQDQHIILDKELRRDIDAIIQRLKTDMFNPADHAAQRRSSRERSLAVTKLQEARHWLGEDLAELNAPYPYPKGNDLTTTEVDPPSDKA